MDPVEQAKANEKLAAQIQDALRTHVVDPTDLTRTEEFLARALGMLYAARPERFRGGMMKEVEGMVEEGVRSGLPHS